MTTTFKRFSKRETFNFAQVEGALCAWEWMLQNQSHTAIDKWHDSLGSPGMRMLAMQAGDICDRVYKHMESIGYEFTSAYDFEFVPSVCLKLDWDALASDNQYSDGLYDPDVHAILLAMIAADKAENTDPDKRNFQRTGMTIDEYIAACRAEADRQWGYADLVSDHPDRIAGAMALGQSPTEITYELGRKYDLMPRSAYLG